MYFEKIGLTFQNRHFQSVSIYSVLSRPCSPLFVLESRLWCFPSLANYYFFRFPNNLTAIKAVEEVNQNIVTSLLQHAVFRCLRTFPILLIRENPLFLNSQQEQQLEELYSEYCRNKPKSDVLVQKHADTFFQGCKDKLGHRLQLPDYLIKPVQRLTKYQLLLKVYIIYDDLLTLKGKMMILTQKHH